MLSTGGGALASAPVGTGFAVDSAGAFGFALAGPASPSTFFIFFGLLAWYYLPFWLPHHLIETPRSLQHSKASNSRWAAASAASARAKRRPIAHLSASPTRSRRLHPPPRRHHHRPLRCTATSSAAAAAACSADCAGQRLRRRGGGRERGPAKAGLEADPRHHRQGGG